MIELLQAAHHRSYRKEQELGGLRRTSPPTLTALKTASNLEETGDFTAILNIKNLPDGLYERLKARAEQQHRSVAQEVTHILDQVLGGAEPLSILDLRGLGKSAWSGVDGAAHVEAERRAWD